MAFFHKHDPDWRRISVQAEDECIDSDTMCRTFPFPTANARLVGMRLAFLLDIHWRGRHTARFDRMIEVINAAAKAGINPRLGVFQGTPGPQFDTPAEAEAARRNGADMLGNGVILETVAAALMGCRVTALILVAEAASSYHGRRLRHADIVDAAQFCSPTIMRALHSMFLESEVPEER